MVTAYRLSKKQVEKARAIFWVSWAIVIGWPTSILVMVWTLNEKIWWGTLVSTVVIIVLGHNVFEFWLKRRQERATNTIVLCYCAHEKDEHKNDRHCLHAGPLPGGNGVKRDCLCLDYAPRFWQMARRT